MRILGLETSCDETGIAIYDANDGLLAHAIYSQIAIHAHYGGVVPELASRDHIRKTLPLIQQVLDKAELQTKHIDGIAYTAGPGLVGALLVGTAIGRSLAWALGIPAIAVHHMEGHLLAPMLESSAPTFPFVALLVSGGHTLLVKVSAVGRYEILGESLDDAVGEAFDKTAKLLGLDYPGGPALAKLAEQGDPARFTFPRPMTNRPGLDFSFSGIKTYAMNTFQKNVQSDNIKADIACAFQDAVIDTLLIKCKRALKQTGINRLVVAGGVSANRLLQLRLTQYLRSIGGQVFFPRQEFCTDNGAMIAYAGYLRLAAGQQAPLQFNAKPRWPLDELVALS